MIHMVSGHGRCGTSMMMQCLRAGGMDIMYEEEHNHGRQLVDGYHPNPKGFFELTEKNMLAEGFLDTVGDRVFKCNFWRLVKMTGDPDREFRIVYMKRNLREVRLSYIAWKGKDFGPARPNALEHVYQQVSERPWVHMTEVWYGEALADPLKEMEKLKSALWPIHPGRAASAVDPELYRNRVREEAVSGWFS